jgi:hypothetical protein
MALNENQEDFDQNELDALNCFEDSERKRAGEPPRSRNHIK